MAVRTREQRTADAFPRLFPWMALSGAPYMGGFHGITPASRLLGVSPSLVARERIEERVEVTLTDVPAVPAGPIETERVATGPATGSGRMDKGGA